MPHVEPADIAEELDEFEAALDLAEDAFHLHQQWTQLALTLLGTELVQRHPHLLRLVMDILC